MQDQMWETLNAVIMSLDIQVEFNGETNDL